MLDQQRIMRHIGGVPLELGSQSTINQSLSSCLQHNRDGHRDPLEQVPDHQSFSRVNYRPWEVKPTDAEHQQGIHRQSWTAMFIIWWWAGDILSLSVVFPIRMLKM